MSCLGSFAKSAAVSLAAVGAVVNPGQVVEAVAQATPGLRGGVNAGYAYITAAVARSVIRESKEEKPQVQQNDLEVALVQHNIGQNQNNSHVNYGLLFLRHLPGAAVAFGVGFAVDAFQVGVNEKNRWYGATSDTFTNAARDITAGSIGVGLATGTDKIIEACAYKQRCCI